MESILFLLLVIIMLLFLAGVFSGGRRGPQARSPRYAESSRRGERATPAALAAMRRAGYRRGADYVDVTDLGLLAYRSEHDARLVRSGDIMLDTDYLRPFVELWVPYQARGQVRFELLDDTGRLRYTDEARYDLDQGGNTLLPRTWLPLQGRRIEPREWTLCVLASDTLLAVHGFGWQEVGGGALQPLIEADGELSPALVQAMRQAARQSLSLDDLLER